jgi:hypothetical protein
VCREGGGRRKEEEGRREEGGGRRGKRRKGEEGCVGGRGRKETFEWTWTLSQCTRWTEKGDSWWSSASCLVCKGGREEERDA